MATRLPYYVGENDIYSQIMGQQQAMPQEPINPYAGFTGGYDSGLYQRMRDEAARLNASYFVPGLLDFGGGIGGDMGSGPGLAGLSAAALGEAYGDAAIGAFDAASADAAAGAAGAAAGADAGAGLGYGGDGGYSGGGEGSGGFYAKGGKVTMSGLLVDETLPGPDDGYAALQAGEYVIKKSATKKLGDKKLQALNEGRASIKMRRK